MLPPMWPRATKPILAHVAAMSRTSRGRRAIARPQVRASRAARVSSLFRCACSCPCGAGALGEVCLEAPEIVEMLARPEQDERGGDRRLVAAARGIADAREQAAAALGVADVRRRSRRRLRRRIRARRTRLAGREARRRGSRAQRARRALAFVMRPSADSDCPARRTRAAPPTSAPMLDVARLAERSARYCRNASSSR